MVRCFDGTHDGVADGWVERYEQREQSGFWLEQHNEMAKTPEGADLGAWMRSSILDMNSDYMGEKTHLSF